MNEKIAELLLFYIVFFPFPVILFHIIVAWVGSCLCFILIFSVMDRQRHIG